MGQVSMNWLFLKTLTFPLPLLSSFSFSLTFLLNPGCLDQTLFWPIQPSLFDYFSNKFVRAVIIGIDRASRNIAPGAWLSQPLIYAEKYPHRKVGIRDYLKIYTLNIFVYFYFFPVFYHPFKLPSLFFMYYQQHYITHAIITIIILIIIIQPLICFLSL